MSLSRESERAQDRPPVYSRSATLLPSYEDALSANFGIDTPSTSSSLQPLPVLPSSLSHSGETQRLPVEQLLHDGATLPPKFRVGDKSTAPVVTLDEVEAHLRILGAFNHLKTRVALAQENFGQSRETVAQLNATEAWIVFLCRAVHRFDKWLRSSPAEGSTPPLDVLMVWHSYMLNPHAYQDDSRRDELRHLQNLNTFPLQVVANLVDPNTFDLAVSEEERSTFEFATSNPFEPPYFTAPADMITLQCPFCVAPTRLQWPWLTAIKTGWAQRGFRVQCPACRASIDHEALGVRRFCDDLALWRAHETASQNGTGQLMGRPVHLAGLMRGNAGKKQAAFLSQAFKPLTQEFSPASGAELARRWGWKFRQVQQFCVQVLLVHRDPNKLEATLLQLQNIFSSYKHPERFSIELTGAVMRQGTFIQKMVEFGWTNPRRFASEKVVLARAIARYHAFLDLMAASPTGFCVPTLDIDLVWHTHQLKAGSYRADTQGLLGFIPNHDDNVEENRLSNSFDLTAQAWTERFGVPYSLCGCVVSDDSRTSRTVRSVKALLPGLSRRSSSAPPAPNNPRPDLISSEDDGDEYASHPSDHNGVVVTNDWQLKDQRGQRQERRTILLERRARDVQKGRADPWAELQQRRAGLQGLSHDPAFFRTIKYWGVSTDLYGDYGFGGAACGLNDGATMANDALVQDSIQPSVNFWWLGFDCETQWLFENCLVHIYS
ncbi:hypothetical protein BKA62DRAFT_775752 [Auriculariales sp. MPI-PUGE-AT-0066]|nr:hypothetical protein BKA62DRAFT_775752 [Auriculariales sp. MPI-PUGE-AT-0066]